MTLIEWMIANDVDDVKLADMLSVDRSTVFRIKHGKQMPSRKTMAAIVEITKGAVQPNTFFGLAPVPNLKPAGCAA